MPQAPWAGDVTQGSGGGESERQWLGKEGQHLMHHHHHCCEEPCEVLPASGVVTGVQLV